MRIKDREPTRPQALPEVGRVGQRRAGEPRGERERRQVPQRPARSLAQDRDRARRRREGEERELLEEQRGDASRPPAPEGPAVEQQEQAGEGDEHRLGEEPEGQTERDGEVAAEARVPGVARVCQQGQHEEEAAEHVLALGNPRYGLDPERVQCEERGDQRRGPERPGEGAQREEEEERVRDVESRVHGVVRAGPDPEELDVRHVGEPGEGMPVGDVQARQRPGGPPDREAFAHDRVLVGVAVVVADDEVVTGDGQIEERTGEGEGHAHGGCHAALGDVPRLEIRGTKARLRRERRPHHAVHREEPRRLPRTARAPAAPRSPASQPAPRRARRRAGSAGRCRRKAYVCPSR